MTDGFDEQVAGHRHALGEWAVRHDNQIIGVDHRADQAAYAAMLFTDKTLIPHRATVSTNALSCPHTALTEPASATL